jgi:hypothetical protein
MAIRLTRQVEGLQPGEDNSLICQVKAISWMQADEGDDLVKEV